MSDQALLTRRHASLASMAETLQNHYHSSFDIVRPAKQLRMVEGDLQIEGVVQPQLHPDGVSPAASGVFHPTEVCDSKIAEKLQIPRQYLRRMRTEGTLDLLSRNVNTWLRQAPDERYLVRTFRDAEGRTGVARSLLSARYKINYNYDVLLAMLDGIRATGIEATIAQCDLTERRLYVRVQAPQVRVLAPRLLRNYRSPFSGALGVDNPVVFAGFTFTNSETGHGAFQITPQITVQICDNGMTLTKDAFREVHLGSELGNGPVRWSQDTQQAMTTALRKQARDAVHTFLDTSFVKAKLAQIEEQAVVPIDEVEPTLEHVGTKLSFSQDEQRDILNHFVRGGDCSAGGVLHAVTSAAQTQQDADAAYDMERKAVPAMGIAAAMHR